MRFPINVAARAAALAPVVTNCTTPPPNGTLPGPTDPAAPWARVLMSTAGRILISDLGESGFTTTLDESVAGTDPSWMAFVEPNLLYAVDEWSATTRLYNLDLDKNQLDLVAERNASAGVVHLEFNPSRTRMVGAAYGNGTIDVWNVEDGGLELIKTIKSDGKPGVVEGRQDAAHPHQAVNDPTGRFFAVNDLGTDEVLLIDSDKDAFDVVNRVRVSPEGCGPRHGVFWPSVGIATHYLVLCEISNLVITYELKYDLAGTSGKGIDFKRVGDVPTWDPKSPPSNQTSAAAGEIVLAGINDIYVSNRLTGDETDSIAHFRFNPLFGGLRFVDAFSSGGKLPRMISVSASGLSLLVATQDGEQGVSALPRQLFSGKVDGDSPRATIPGSTFGEPGFGPKFIKQIA